MPSAASWLSAGLGALGIGFAGVAALAIPLAGAWAALSLWLARQQQRRLNGQTPSVRADSGAAPY